MPPQNYISTAILAQLRAAILLKVERCKRVVTARVKLPENQAFSCLMDFKDLLYFK
jgi:hypothetical protein